MAKASARDSTARSARDELALFGRYTVGLRRFLKTPVRAADAQRRIAERLRRREESFLQVLERGVFGRPRSAYRKLIDHAGIELGDVRRLVSEDGLEPALERLHEAGVYVTLDEFKGRRPIERAGLTVDTRPGDFVNPLMTQHLPVKSGGSRGSRRRGAVDLDMLAYEAGHHSLFLTAFDLWRRPMGLWRSVPPGPSGLNNSLRQIKLGNRVAAWFSPYKAPLGPEAVKFSTFTRYSVAASRIWGGPIPAPEYVHVDDAVRVARWLAERAAEGSPALLDTQASLAVRTCMAAERHGLDIAGTFFRLGGEPYTPGKAKVIAASGSRAACHYSMNEVSRVGIACGHPAALDDVHMLTDKVAVMQREKAIGESGRVVGALHLTSLIPTMPTLMLNVEVDDYGVLEHRRCGCPADELGLTLHLHGIRSYEKLTSEGIQFLGSDLIALVEEVLPARFGGHATDYQLVEEEENGLPKVAVVVSPRVGPIDDREVVDTALRTLRSKRRNTLMAERLREAGTLRVVRREPYTTPASKILSLHTVRAGDGDRATEPV